MDARRFSPSLALLLTCLASTSCLGAVISEIRVDQPGPDADEYFELTGEPGESLDGLTYVVLGDGPLGSGEIEAVIPLEGHVLPADGVFLVTEATHADVAQADIVTLLSFENGDNNTHLLVRDFVGSLDDDLDQDDDCVLDVTPWSAVVDAVALVVELNPPRTTECHYGRLGARVGPDGSFAPGSAYRCGDSWFVGSFEFGREDTPGAPNRRCVLVADRTSWGLIKASFR